MTTDVIPINPFEGDYKVEPRVKPINVSRANCPKCKRTMGVRDTRERTENISWFWCPECSVHFNCPNIFLME